MPATEGNGFAVLPDERVVNTLQALALAHTTFRHDDTPIGPGPDQISPVPGRQLVSVSPCAAHALELRALQCSAFVLTEVLTRPDADAFEEELRLPLGVGGQRQGRQTTGCAARDHDLKERARAQRPGLGLRDLCLRRCCRWSWQSLHDRRS